MDLQVDNTEGVSEGQKRSPEHLVAHRGLEGSRRHVILDELD